MQIKANALTGKILKVNNPTILINKIKNVSFLEGSLNPAKT